MIVLQQHHGDVKLPRYPPSAGEPRHPDGPHRRQRPLQGHG